MFGKAKSSWDIICSAVQAFITYPQLIVPLLLSWVLYAGTTLYFYFEFDWNVLGAMATIGTCFGIILFFSTLLCFSACWLFEVVEQIETGRELNLSDAFSEAVGSNLIRMLPIAFVWATIWFALIIIDVLTSKEEDDDDDRELSFESATRVLSGIDGEVSWFSLSLEMLKKLVRMLTFLSLPAICWRNIGPFAAMNESLRTARRHTVEFLSGYALSGAVAAFLFLPAALPIYLDSKDAIHLPDAAWPPLIIYLAFAWSFSIYIEQMFTAELYM